MPVLKHNVKAVVLVEDVDLGGCPIESRIPRAFWPVGEKTVLDNLIEQLAEQGIKRFAVVGAASIRVDEEARRRGGGRGRAASYELRSMGYELTEQGENSSQGDEKARRREDEKRLLAGAHNDGLKVKWIEEEMPRGRGGAMLDAAEDEDELLLVVNSNILSAPDLDEIIDAHATAEADMTIATGPSGKSGSMATDAAQVFICSRTVLEYIPDVGYCDIKEGLLPRLVAAGKKILSVSLPRDIGAFKSWQEYLGATLGAVANYEVRGMSYEWGGRSEEVGRGGAASYELRSMGYELMEQGDKGRRGDEKAIQTEVEERRSEEGNSSRRGDEETRSQVGVDIHETARIVGPVMICEGAVVEKDAIIVGPAVIGPNVHIGRGAVVSESVLWEGSSVGQASVVTQCLLTCGAHAAGSQMLTERLLTAKHTVRAEKAKTPLPATSKEPPPKKTLAMMTDRFRRRLPLAGLEALLSRPSATWVGAAILLACFFLTYWEPTIKDLWRIWMRSDEFSSGLLVPFLACYVLGSQRHRLSNCTIRPCLWGIVAFAGAQTMRFFGLWLMYSSAERLSIVMTVIAVILLVFGWRLVLRIWPVLLYLFFMLPLPGRVQTWITQPLQRWATHSAVFGLETLGYNVAREGNIINMNGVRVEVAQACNGLRMLTAFFVIAGLVALLVHRRWWEKLIIIASSIPIAFACNTLRLIITSIAFTVLNVEQWEKAFHDFGGLAMMPLALGLIVVELWLLSHLIVEHPAVPVNVNLTSEGVSPVIYGKDRKRRKTVSMDQQPR